VRDALRAKSPWSRRSRSATPRFKKADECTNERTNERRRSFREAFREISKRAFSSRGGVESAGKHIVAFACASGCASERETYTRVTGDTPRSLPRTFFFFSFLRVAAVNERRAEREGRGDRGFGP
jgi:hypothetical protein